MASRGSVLPICGNCQLQFINGDWLSVFLKGVARGYHSNPFPEKIQLKNTLDCLTTIQEEGLSGGRLPNEAVQGIYYGGKLYHPSFLKKLPNWGDLDVIPNTMGGGLRVMGDLDELRNLPSMYSFRKL